MSYVVYTMYSMLHSNTDRPAMVAYCMLQQYW